MCVETLQRFMGFALASMQDLALDETSKNAATNVVSVMVNGIYSGNNARYGVRQKNLTIFNLK
jgi:hexokinase